MTMEPDLPPRFFLYTVNKEKLNSGKARDEANQFFSGFSVGLCINEEKVIFCRLELGK